MSSSVTWLHDALRQSGQRLLDAEVALVESPGPDAVHEARVASRRLRSVLRVFGPLLSLEEQVRVRLDADLRAYARGLGPLRDTDALGEIAHARLDSLPAEYLMGPVHEEVDEALGERRHAVAALWRDRREAADLRDVVRLVADPPVRPDVRPKKAAKLLSKAAHKAERHRRAADGVASLHRARRAARRLRYAAEVAPPKVGHAKRRAKQAKRTQRVLGRHHDLVALTAFARDQGARYGGRDQHNGFAYGVLLAQTEQERLMLEQRSGTGPG